MFYYSTVKFELIEQNYTVVTVSYTTDCFLAPGNGCHQNNRVAVLGFPLGLCGRKTTLNSNWSITVPTISVGLGEGHDGSGGRALVVGVDEGPRGRVGVEGGVHWAIVPVHSRRPGALHSHRLLKHETPAPALRGFLLHLFLFLSFVPVFPRCFTPPPPPPPPAPAQRGFPATSFPSFLLFPHTPPPLTSS